LLSHLQIKGLAVGLFIAYPLLSPLREGFSG